jgi:hypothetical protein
VGPRAGLDGCGKFCLHRDSMEADKVKVMKVKFALEKAMEAQTECRVIALLFL